MPAKLNARWLLLRGLTREQAHWGEFPAKLQTAFPSEDVQTLDLPGTGCYYQRTSPPCIPAITGQIRHDAERRGWLHHGPIHLLAISLGGMVAWDWLQTYPDDIKSAALINISLAGISPFYHRLRWQCYLSMLKLITAKSLYHRELEIIKFVSNRPELYETLAQDWAQIQQLRPVSSKNAFNQLLAAACYRPAAASPHIPVLLLNSKGDRMVEPCCSEAIAKRCNLPLLTHPSAGHELCLDAGDWVINQIKTWRVNNPW